MNFDWADYLSLAQDLVKQATSSSHQEARLRSAVSRAYYAAFRKAGNHLRDRDGLSVPTGRDVHGWVRDQFQGSPDRSRRQIGADLGRLRIDRNKVDYDDSVGGLSSMTSLSISLAERVIVTLSKI